MFGPFVWVFKVASVLICFFGPFHDLVPTVGLHRVAQSMGISALTTLLFFWSVFLAASVHGLSP